MANAHLITPQGTTQNSLTARLGASATTGANLTPKETGKFAKLVAESNYDLASAGDKIEGVITSVDLATQAGWTIGGVVTGGIMWATADGLEATAGTGTIAVGDYVVVGTAVAKDTALTTWPKVCKATNQPGTALVSTVGSADTAAAVKTQLDAVLVKLADAQKNVMYAWRVLSLGTVGTGAVGTDIVIQRVTAPVSAI